MRIRNQDLCEKSSIRELWLNGRIQILFLIVTEKNETVQLHSPHYYFFYLPEYC